MSGKISDDADKVVDGTEAVAAAHGGSNYGIRITSIATFLAAQAKTLTNKTIDAANNTISNLATSMFAANVIDTDGTLAANSDTRIASQKALKTYADALIAANDAMVFKGATDCSANPNYPAANRGDTYRVSVAGKIGGASGVVVEAGDIFICNTDSTSSGNQATVGTAWNVIQMNIDGAVVGPASATDNALARFDATTGKIVQNSEVTLGDSDGKLSRTAGISVQGTNTNDSAATGYVGEYVSNTLAYGSRVTFSSGTGANITSISLGAGDWDISGFVNFEGTSSPATSYTIASISSVSATIGGEGYYAYGPGITTVVLDVTGVIPTARFSLSATTTIYLVGLCGINSGTIKGWGAIAARRVR